MNLFFNRFGAILVLACTLPASHIALAQPVDWSSNPGQHREYREAERMDSYTKDVLRNNRKECGVLRHAHEERQGRIMAECLSNNKSRELTYLIELGSSNSGARVMLVSNQHNRDMQYREGNHLDRR